MLRTLLLVPLLCLAPAPAQPPAQKITVKLATLVPDGSIWDKAFKQMGADWKKASDGKIRLRIYPGGVAGDEPDIVRKMRIGQLQAAALTVSGLGMIDPSFKLFEMPMFFENYGELLHVIEKLTPDLNARLQEKGFVLLHWGPAGWIKVFSKQPIETIGDLKSQKLFVWAGDNYMVQWWHENGFRPVPLAVPDVPTGLQTGLIESLPTTPLAALSLQWFRSTPYMLDLELLPYLGATIITEKTWKKLSEEERAEMLEAARSAQSYLTEEVPKQEDAAVKEMRERGLNVTQASDHDESSPWRAISDSFASKVRGSRVPVEIYDKAVRERDAYRALHSGTQRSGGSSD